MLFYKIEILIIKSNKCNKQTNKQLKMNTIETIEYGNLSINTLRTVFGEEMTYNDLAFLPNEYYDLKVEFNRNKETQLVRVWFDEKVVMDSKYSINHSCIMFYHLSEIKTQMEERKQEEEEIIIIKKKSKKSKKEEKPKKITKDDKIEIINSFFAKDGKKMTNLVKATVAKLDDIITKYSIPVNEMFNDLNEKRLQKKIKNEEDKKKYEEEKIIRNIEELRFKNEMKIKWKYLTDKEKDECYMKMMEVYNDGNYEEHNEKIKNETDAMERNFKKEGCIVEREDINILKINGVTLVNGYLKEKPNIEENLKVMREEDQQEFTYCNKLIIPLINKMIEEKEGLKK
jgi:hypothetical protein